MTQFNQTILERKICVGNKIRETFGIVYCPTCWNELCIAQKVEMVPIALQRNELRQRKKSYTILKKDLRQSQSSTPDLERKKAEIVPFMA